MKIIYVINVLADGGAELGLCTLVERGFFAGHQLVVCHLKGAGLAAARLEGLIGPPAVRPIGNSLVSLSRLIRRERADVVVASLSIANVLARFATLTCPRVLFVAFEHTTSFENELARKMLVLTRFRVDLVFYDHPATWKVAQGWNRNSVKSCYVPLTVQQGTSVLRPKSNPLRLLSFGRLVVQKNYVELLLSLRQVLDEGFALSLTIAGDGRLRSELTELIGKLRLGDHVSLPGFSDAAKLRDAADVYIQCSIYEGLGLSTVEAMSEGLLVVSTDVGGAREYGRDGDNMIKIRGTGNRDISDALRKVLTMDTTAARAMRQRAVADSVREFGAEAVNLRWASARRVLENAASEKKNQ